MNELLTGLGIEAPEVNEPETTEPETTEPETVPETTEPEVTEPSGTPEPTNTKQNKAFAEMRVQNQTYQKAMKSLGDLLGAKDINDPTAILNLVQEKIVQAQAKQQGVPAELLNKLNMLEAQQQMNNQKTIQQEALLGFQTVKTKYELSEKELNNFSDELVQMGLNPFEQKVDLARVYRDVHFEELQTKAIEKALEAERVRATKAAQTSTTPGSITGATGDNNQAQIKDVRGLEEWFSKK